MKPKTAIFLTTVLVAVVVVIIVRHSDLFKTKPGEEFTGKEVPVWKTPFGDPMEILIVPAEGEKIRLVKKEGVWHLVEPLEARASNFQARKVFEPIKNFKYERVFAPDDPQAPGAELTGLDKPAWIITITDSEGTTRAVHIGRAVPLTAGKKSYVRPAGSKRTYVFSGVNFFARFTRPWAIFRDRNVLSLDKDRIVRIRVDGREKIDLAKQDDRWGITEPIAAEADKDAVAGIIGKFAGLWVEEFVDDDPKTLRPYGLEAGSERLVVRIWLKPKSPATAPTTQPSQPQETYALAIGSKTQQQWYAKLDHQPSVFLVSDGTFDILQATLKELREKKVMPLEPDHVLRVELDLPGGKAELVKRGQHWQMTHPYAGKANDDAVGNLLEKISDLRADSFQDNVAALGSFGLAPAAGKITIHQAGRSDKLTLLLGDQSASGEMTFVKRAASDVVAVVKSADVKELLAETAGYWNTTIFELPVAAKVTQMAIERPDGKFVLRRSQEDNGSWSLTAPLASPADSENVNKLLDRLEKLQATKVVALGPKVPPRYAKASKRIVVNFTTAAEPASQPTTQPAAEAQPAASGVIQEHVTRLAKIDNKTYAWVERDDEEPTAVGQFAASLFEVFTAELRNRTIWKIEPEEIHAIRLLTGEDTTPLELKRDGNSWTYTADPFVTIDPEKVTSFLEDLEEIQAEKFASHRRPSRADKKRFGLKEAWLTLELTPAEGEARQIIVASKGEDETKNRYATASGFSGVFVLSGETAAKMAKKLKDFTRR